MKHDYKSSADKNTGKQFRAWLENETISSLRRSHGDIEATKAAVFLYVNRAYESHMPERMIAEVFGKSLVIAGYTEQEEEPMLYLLEGLAQLAKGVHGSS